MGGLRIFVSRSSPGTGDDKPVVGPCPHSLRTVVSEEYMTWTFHDCSKGPFGWFSCQAFLRPSIKRFNYSSFLGLTHIDFAFCLTSCCVQEIETCGSRLRRGEGVLFRKARAQPDSGNIGIVLENFICITQLGPQKTLGKPITQIFRC